MLPCLLLIVAESDVDRQWSNLRFFNHILIVQHGYEDSCSSRVACQKAHVMDTLHIVQELFQGKLRKNRVPYLSRKTSNIMKLLIPFNGGTLNSLLYIYYG